MRVLFIVHATSWSDKGCVAKAPITELILGGSADRIIEVIPSPPDIREGRYLQHDGDLLEHDEISPVRFFREELFGDQPRFPAADEVTLVGGVLNATGGGCLNVAFDHLVRHLHRSDRSTTIIVPIRATYRAWRDGRLRGAFEIEQIVKDLAWKMMVARVSFELSFGAYQLEAPLPSAPRMRLIVDAGI